MIYLKTGHTTGKMEILQLQPTKKKREALIPGFPSGKTPIERTGSKRLCMVYWMKLDKDMVNTARVNRGLWVEIRKEAQHAGKLDGILRRLPVNVSGNQSQDPGRLANFTTQRLKNTLSVTQCFLRFVTVSAVMTFATCVFQMCGTNTCISPREKPERVWRYRLHYAVMPLG